MTDVTTSDGVRLYAEATGSGLPVLFIHEFAADHRAWSRQVDALSGTFRCITYASRGYPPSEVPPEQDRYNYLRQADDAIDVLDAFGIARAHVVGLSMGGFCALQLGIRYPDRVSSLLVASAGSGSSPGGRAAFLAETELMAAAFRADGMAAVSAKQAMGPNRIQLRRKDRQVWEEFAEQLAEHSAEGMALTVIGIQRSRPSLYDITDQLAGITAPTLVVNGDEDEACLEAGLLLKRTIPAAGLAVVPNSGHVLNLEEPELFNDLIRRLVGAAEAGTWATRDPRSRSASMGIANSGAAARANVLHAGPAGYGKLAGQLREAVEKVGGWMAGYGDFAPHPSLDVPLEQLEQATGALHERLRENYPFFHPRYIGQMLKPPHPAAVIGYVSAMLINPNNHALDGGPATARMEKEVVAQLAAMFGLPAHLGHLTSSGTIANLEALFVARQIHPGKAVAHSADAHYTHGRMCHVLGVEAVAVPTAADGTMDLQALEETLRGGRIGTVVATPGTTGLGAVDPVHEIVARCRRYGARVHVDAAYGGFFRLIADGSPEGVAAEPFAAIAECDSVVVDPHKHGLQPYGCGAVLFRDPGVARHYLHDSPYTYFTSDELHLGEISLECSRAGAAAAALWLTLQLLPLTPDGLGAVLRPGRRAALAWADLIDTSDELTLFQRPHLDILSYFPTRRSLSEIDHATAHVLNAGMHRPAARSLFVATYTVDGASLSARGHRVAADVASGRILRSVLMKPETEEHVPALHQQVLDLLADS